MKKIISYFLAVLLILSLDLITILADQSSKAQKNIAILKGGNSRFVNDERTFKYQDSISEVDLSNIEKQPLAIVVNCAEMKMPHEIIFDCIVGNIYSIKSPANIIDKIQIATIEYALKYYNIPFLLILGHNDCNIIKEVINSNQFEGNLNYVAGYVKPSIDKTIKILNDAPKEKILNGSIKANLFQSIETLLKHSQIIRDYIYKGRLTVEVAIYNVETRRIEWLGKHPNEKSLLESKLNELSENADEDNFNTKNFFNNKNTFFIIAFIVLCSVISGSIIFLVIYLKGRR